MNRVKDPGGNSLFPDNNIKKKNTRFRFDNFEPSKGYLTEIHLTYRQAIFSTRLKING